MYYHFARKSWGAHWRHKKQPLIVSRCPRCRVKMKARKIMVERGRRPHRAAQELYCPKCGRVQNTLKSETEMGVTERKNPEDTPQYVYSDYAKKWQKRQTSLKEKIKRKQLE